MADYSTIQVSADHTVAVSTLGGGTFTVTCETNGPIYYGDKNVTATTNNGSLTAGSTSSAFSQQTYLIGSAVSSTVQIVYTPPVGGGGGVSVIPTSGLPSDPLIAARIASPGNLEFNRIPGIYFPTSACIQTLRTAVARARAGGPPARYVIRGDSTTLGVIGGSAAQGTPQTVNVITATTSSSVNPTILTNVLDFRGIANGQTVVGTGIPTSTTISSFSATASTITMNKSATASSTTSVQVSSSASPTNQHAYVWADQGRKQAVARNVLGGLISESVMSFDTADPRCTFGTGWSSGAPMTVASTATGSFAFADDSQSNAFDVILLSGSGFPSGTIAMHIDSDADTTFTAPSTSNVVWTQRVSMVSPSVGTHTLTIKAPSAGSVKIIAVEPVNTTTPSVLRIGRVGVSGQSVATLAPTNTGNGSSMSFLLAGKPDVMHLHMGINDMHFWTTTNGTPAAGAALYLTNLNAWVTAATTAGGQAVFTVWPSYGYSDATQGSDPAYEAIDTWHQSIYTSADANNVPVLDLQRRWGYGNTPTLGNYAMFDGVHPTVAGYADVGTFFADFLSLI